MTTSTRHQAHPVQPPVSMRADTCRLLGHPSSVRLWSPIPYGHSIDPRLTVLGLMAATMIITTVAALLVSDRAAAERDIPHMLAALALAVVAAWTVGELCARGGLGLGRRAVRVNTSTLPYDRLALRKIRRVDPDLAHRYLDALWVYADLGAATSPEADRAWAVLEQTRSEVLAAPPIHVGSASALADVLWPDDA